jgi:hypothetical protein
MLSFIIDGTFDLIDGALDGDTAVLLFQTISCVI